MFNYIWHHFPHQGCFPRWPEQDLGTRRTWWDFSSETVDDEGLSESGRGDSEIFRLGRIRSHWRHCKVRRVRPGLLHRAFQGDDQVSVLFSENKLESLLGFVRMENKKSSLEPRGWVLFCKGLETAGNFTNTCWGHVRTFVQMIRPKLGLTLSTKGIVPHSD